MNALVNAVVPHRRALVVAALLGSVAGIAAASPTVRLVLFGVAVAVSLLGVERSDRTDALLVGGGAFATPRTRALVAGGMTHMLVLPLVFGLGVGDPAVRAPWLALLAAFVAPLAYYGWGWWHGVGVTLTPSGVRADKLTGSAFVPWTALATDQPRQDSDDTVVLAVAGTMSTRGRPLDPERLVFAGTSGAFLAGAIRHYVARPGERAAIGTAEGYERLLAASVPAAQTRPAARTRAWIARTAVTGLLLAGTTLPLFAWTTTRLDGHGLLAELPQFLVPGLLLGLGMMVHAVWVAYRRAHPAPDPPAAAEPAAAARPAWSRDVTNGT